MYKTIPAFFLLSIAFSHGKAQSVVYDPAQDMNAPVLAFREPVYDFGTIRQGENVKHDYVFTNTGKSPLVISDARSSCGCLVPSWPKEPIPPGKSGIVSLYFNPSGKIGPQAKQVTVTSNNRNGTVILTIKGKVEALPAAESPFPPGSVSPAKSKAVGPSETGAAEMRFEKTTIDFGTITQPGIPIS
ncbi:MAG: hypothetical protein FD123_3679 [Bacteroidetes bacterium]|nr:MAG: hypothetical protein FD123_3679 [Bacteroidota bacterium]